MFLRLSALAVYIFWNYWWFSHSPTDPKTAKKRTGLYFLSKYANIIFVVIIALQLLGLQVLPMSSVLPMHDIVGIIVFLLGIAISVRGRIDLSSNWTPGYNYQNYTTRKSQTITKNGIYQDIRHPIYLGIFLVYIGAEILARSYVVFALFLLVGIIYWQAKKEESLLLSRFGKPYKEYMKHSKMFIPFLW